MKTPSKLSSNSLDVSLSSHAAELHQGKQAPFVDERVGESKTDEWKRVERQKQDSDAKGADQEATTEHAIQPTDEQLSFDFGMVEGFAWNQNNNGSELSEYLAVGEDYSPAEYASFGEQGSAVTVAGIRPVPLAAVPREEAKEVAPVETSTKSESPAKGASTPTAPAAPATEAQTPAPAPSAPAPDTVADQAPNAEQKSNAPSTQDGPPVWVAGFALLGLGGGGGGGGAVVPPVESDPVKFVLSGLISMGTVTKTSSLVLQAFKDDGSLLKGTVTLNPGGSFTIGVTEAYSGVVLLRVYDTSDAADYVDEGTGATKDLTSDLRAMFSVSGSGTSAVALNPLTELAVRKLTGDVGGDGGLSGVDAVMTKTAVQVGASNATVAAAFGLSGDLISTSPVTVDSTNFAAGSLASQAYGQALAAISGMEAMAGESTGEVLKRLVDGITGDGASATLSPVLLTEYAQGAAQASRFYAENVLDGNGPNILQISPDTLPEQAVTLGHELTVNVAFDEPVVVSGEPTLSIRLGVAGETHAVTAVYAGGSGTKNLSFVYTVDIADAQADAVTIDIPANAITLNGATFKDLLGNTADVGHDAFASSSTFPLDSSGPVVVSLSVASSVLVNQPLALGESFEVQVNFNESVYLNTQNGQPQLPVMLLWDGGAQSAMATYVSGSGTSQLTFRGVVDAEGVENNAVAVRVEANAFDLHGAIMVDALGNTANLTHQAFQSSSQYSVDTVAPVISQIALSGSQGMQNGWLNAGDQVTATVGFNEAMQMDVSNGTPTLALKVGSTKALATFSKLSDSGMSADFVLTIKDGQSDVDGISIDADALALNGAVLSDVAGNSVLIHSTAVVANAAYKVDTAPPLAPTELELDLVDNTGTKSDLVTYLTSGLTILGKADPGFTVVLFESAGAELARTVANVSGVWSVNVDLAQGTHALQAQAIDMAGNAGQAVSQTLLVTVDETAPFLKSFAIDGLAGSYKAGDALTLIATASEKLVAGGQIEVVLSTGDAVTLTATGDSPLLTSKNFEITSTLTGEPTLLEVVSYNIVDGFMVTDVAGNEFSQVNLDDLPNIDSVMIDTVPPQVSRVAVVSATGAQGEWLSAGDVIQVDVQMSEVVHLHLASDSVPTLVLSSGAPSTTQIGLAQYVSGSGSNTLRFEYTVAEGDASVSSLLPGVNGLDLGGATLQDAAGNLANIEFSQVFADQSFKVLTTSPSIESVTLPAGNAVAGDTVSFTLVVSDDGGEPYQDLQGKIAGFDVENLVRIDATTYQASFTVTRGSVDVALGGIVNTDLSITDAAGNVSARYAADAVTSGDFSIDAKEPVLLELVMANAAQELVNNTLTAGSVLRVDANFTEAVTVQGQVLLPVEMGNETVNLVYAGGSGTSTLHFTYTVQPGDNDVDGITIGANVLAASEEAILDLSGQAALQSNPALTSGGVKIDTTAPGVLSFFTDKPAGSYAKGTQVKIYAQMNEAVSADSKLSILLNSGATLNLTPSEANSTQMRGIYTVGSGENASALQIDSFTVAGVFDLAGNEIIESNVPTNNLPSVASQAIVVDTVKPVVSPALVLNQGDTGVNQSDAITKQTTGLTVTTTVDLGTTVELFDSGKSLGVEQVETGVGGTTEWSKVVDLTEGTHQLYVVTKDAAGNTSTASPTLTVVVDAAAPVVETVALMTESGETDARLRAGDKVIVDVTLSESAWLQGATTIAPSLSLSAAGTPMEAVYLSGSGSKTLRFVATVPEGLTDLIGVTVESNSLQLGSQTLTDTAGNAVVLTHDASVVSSGQMLIDNLGPSVTGVALEDRSANPNVLVWQDKVYVNVTFDETVVVKDQATPKLALAVNNPLGQVQTVYASYDSGSGSSTLRFAYEIGSGLYDQNGLRVPAGALQLNASDDISDVAGNALYESTYVASIPPVGTYIVDATPPQIVDVVFASDSGSDTWLNAGEHVSITLTFDEDVVFVGTEAKLLLDVGGQSADATATYPNAPSKVLTFDWTLPDGYQSNTVNLQANTHLIEAGFLRDAQGNPVDTRLANVAEYLVHVDSMTPHIVKFSAPDVSGQVFLRAGDTVTIQAEFNETLYFDNYQPGDTILSLHLDSGEDVVLNQWTVGTKIVSGVYTIATGNSLDLAVDTVTISQLPHDEAGNVMLALNDLSTLQNLDLSNDVVIDTEPPPAPTITLLVNDSGYSATDFYTNEQRLELKGTAEAYARVVVKDGDKTVGVVEQAEADGRWSLILSDVLVTTNGLPDGAHSITAQATDRAGNSGPVSQAVSVYVDTQSPAIASVALETGVPMNIGDEVSLFITLVPDAINTNDAYYNVRGTVNGFELYGLTPTNDAAIYEAKFKVAELGSDVAIDGAISVANLIIEDKAGNTNTEAYSAEVSSATHPIDANRPVIESVSILSATGLQSGYLNAGDEIFVQVVMSEAVKVNGDAPLIALTLSDASGDQTVEATYDYSKDADHTLVFKYVVAQGDVAGRGIAINANALIFAEGSSVTDGVDNSEPGNVADTAHDAVAVNAAYKIDTQAPDQPGVVELLTTDDTGPSDAYTQDGLTQTNGIWHLAGTAEAGSKVAVWIDGIERSPGVTATASGVWEIAVPASATDANAVFLDGSYAVTVVATDPAGNPSIESEVLEITVDNTSPTVVATAWGEAKGMQNNFLSVGDEIFVKLTFSESVFVTDDSSLPSVQLVFDTGDQTASYASGSGTAELVFSYIVQAGDTAQNGIGLATNSLSMGGARITDFAGNLIEIEHDGILGVADYAQVDTTVPDAPSVLKFEARDDTVVYVGYQNDLHLSMTAEPGATVKLFADKNGNGTLDSGESISAVMTEQVPGDGNWDITLDLAEGTYNLRTLVEDAAGNVSGASEALTLHVDISAPQAPGALKLAEESDFNTGDLYDNTTSVTTLTSPTGGLKFKVSVEEGATVEIKQYGGDGHVLEASAIENGELTITDDLLSAPGTYELYAIATDAAGNVSEIGTISTLVIDNAKPDQITDFWLSQSYDKGIRTDDGITNLTTGLAFEGGGAEVGTTVTLYRDSAGENEVGHALVNALGNWLIQDVTLAAGKTYELYAQAKDKAGNLSDMSDPIVVTVDTTPPALSGVSAWDISGGDGKYTSGDMVKLVFSEPIQVDAVIDNLATLNEAKLGKGALVQADAPLNGLSTTFWVTLGATPTLKVGDVVTLAVQHVVDEAGNLAIKTISAAFPTTALYVPDVHVDVLPASNAGDVTTTGLWGGTRSDLLVGVGDRVAGQYAYSAFTQMLIDDGVITSSSAYGYSPSEPTKVLEVIATAGSSRIEQEMVFRGGDGEEVDFVTLYGQMDLMADRASFENIEHIRILGDVTLSRSQLMELIAQNVAIDGGGRGILRIVDDFGNNPVVAGYDDPDAWPDFSTVRLANLAQLDLGADVNVILSQDNVDQIAAISGQSGATIEASTGTLTWSNLTAYGDVVVGSSSGAVTDLRDLVDTAHDGTQLFVDAINQSLSAATNSLLNGVNLPVTQADYVPSALVAASLSTVSRGNTNLSNSVVAFEDGDQHWLIGGNATDFMQGGDQGDVFWVGAESKATAGVINTVWGGAGDDIVVAGANVDVINTGAGDDYISAGAGADNIDAGLGNDFIRSGSSSDRIIFQSYIEGDGSLVAGFGVDLFDAGVVGDQFDFSALNIAMGLAALTTEGSAAVVHATAATLSNDAPQSAAVVVVDGSNLGHDLSFDALFETNSLKDYSRVAIWESETGVVDMAFVRDTANGSEVTTFAHLLLGGESQGFLSNLTYTDFILA